mmetsp:Transcript_24771/g.50822  ORF Transcript_24771/g.50822 Transcript_24771/m.50822 type:complete len:286 (+) Transcript_24771:1141-1998(+)
MEAPGTPETICSGAARRAIPPTTATAVRIPTDGRRSTPSSRPVGTTTGRALDGSSSTSPEDWPGSCWLPAWSSLPPHSGSRDGTVGAGGGAADGRRRSRGGDLQSRNAVLEAGKGRKEKVTMEPTTVHMQNLSIQALSCLANLPNVAEQAAKVRAGARAVARRPETTLRMMSIQRKVSILLDAAGPLLLLQGRRPADQRRKRSQQLQAVEVVARAEASGTRSDNDLGWIHRNLMYPASAFLFLFSPTLWKYFADASLTVRYVYVSMLHCYVPVVSFLNDTEIYNY